MNKLRFGILGTAKIARSVVPHIVASEMAEVVAVASRSLPKAEQFAAEFGIPHAFGDYETLLQNDSIDAARQLPRVAEHMARMEQRGVVASVLAEHFAPAA